MSGYYDRTGKYHPAGSGGRHAGWWTYAAPRPSNGIGISPELPAGRAVGWNVAFIAAEMAGALTVHVVFGVPWWQLGLAFAAVLLLGGGLLTYVVMVATPRALRRHEALLRAHLTTARVTADAARPPIPQTSRTTTSGTGTAA